jgi:hypothetical protein
MEHVGVESSTVASVAHDAEKSVLEVRFHNGGLYRYQNVTPAMFRDVLEARSVGAHINRVIKPACACEKVRGR